MKTCCYFCKEERNYNAMIKAGQKVCSHCKRDLDKTHDIQDWKEELTDEFCVLFERGGEQFAELLEKFISNIIKTEREKWNLVLENNSYSIGFVDGKKQGVEDEHQRMSFVATEYAEKAREELKKEMDKNLDKQFSFVRQQEREELIKEVLDWMSEDRYYEKEDLKNFLK